MPQVTYTTITTPGLPAVVTVVIPGVPVTETVATDDHPNFAAIVAEVAKAAQNGNTLTDSQAEALVELFDIGDTIAARFEKLSERITVRNGEVLIDGDVADDSITRQILRFLDEGEDFTPLVRFAERLLANPNDHSRTQLYDWLRAHQENEGLTITEDGRIVTYKGVQSNPDSGVLESQWTGKATVYPAGSDQGEEVEGHIPNEVGSVIEMPRSDVRHDPRTACSTGLHCGTFDYAQTYARGAMLKVIVDPRDVVSVPSDAGGQKVRVCRYEVAAVIDAPVSGAVEREGYYEPNEYDEYADDDFCDDPDCGCADEDDEGVDLYV